VTEKMKRKKSNRSNDQDKTLKNKLTIQRKVVSVRYFY